MHVSAEADIAVAAGRFRRQNLNETCEDDINDNDDDENDDNNNIYTLENESEKDEIFGTFANQQKIKKEIQKNKEYLIYRNSNDIIYYIFIGFVYTICINYF